jgi:hypothetical protein
MSIEVVMLLALFISRLGGEIIVGILHALKAVVIAFLAVVAEIRDEYGKLHDRREQEETDQRETKD